MMRKDATMGFIGMTAFALVALVGWVSCADYKLALEQENERLRGLLTPKSFQREAYQAVLCPSGNSIAQRIDKRRWDGVIYEAKWRRTCV